MFETLKLLPGHQSFLECGTFGNVCKFFGLQGPANASMSDLLSLRRQLKRDINLYSSDEGTIHPLYAPRSKFPDSEPVNIWIEEAPDATSVLTGLSVICNPNFIKAPYRCSFPNCNYSTFKKSNFDRHEEICEDYNTQKILSEQKPFGTDMDTMTHLVNLGILPEEAVTFRKTTFWTYDIECIEDPTGAEGNVEAFHKPVCISVANNYEFVETVVRENSTHEAALEMVAKFVEILEFICDQDRARLPDYFIDGEIRLAELVEDAAINFEKKKWTGLLGRLRDYMSTDVYGFNSCKYLFY